MSRHNVASDSGGAVDQGNSERAIGPETLPSLDADKAGTPHSPATGRLCVNVTLPGTCMHREETICSRRLRSVVLPPGEDGHGCFYDTVSYADELID